MKKHWWNILRTFLYAACVLAACDDMEDQPGSPGISGSQLTETGTSELYVLSEGLFNLNNSSLARYSFRSGELNKHYFEDINGRGLGDTANDMALYGGKLYIVVNVSSTIEVIDFYSGVVIKQVPMLTENGSSRQPRHIAFCKDKAYVCSYDGTVARIDTASLQVEAVTQAGRNPEDLCIQNGKLYVSNSGGLDYTEGIGVDRTVSVIDIQSFKEIKKITVGPNPGKIEAGEDEKIYVATYGEQISQGDFQLVEIDSRTDEVSRTFNEPVMDFALNGNIAYLHCYNSHNETSAIKVFNLSTGTTLRENFITDGTEINTPYGICINPYSGNIYITEAYSYTITGDVLCFNQNGQLQFKLERIGLNPNTVVFSRTASAGNGETDNGNDDKLSAFARKVLEYRPAPGQFMNTPTTGYKEGFTAEDVRSYAEEQLQDPDICLLSLGAYGGYITLAFDHTVENVAGEADIKIYGNAYYDAFGTLTGEAGGSAEPGIVCVSKDTNGNGLPDDEWFELAGSEYYAEETIKNYTITYYRPENLLGDVFWTDSEGNEGYVKRNEYYTANSYYPTWIEEDEMTFSGSRLKDNAVNEPQEGMPEHWVGYCYGWGYADNHPNNTEQSKLWLEWAVDSYGNRVDLDGIDFIRIYTAVNQNCGWMGEISTEIQAVEDLHYSTE